MEALGIKAGHGLRVEPARCMTEVEVRATGSFVIAVHRQFGHQRRRQGTTRPTRRD